MRNVSKGRFERMQCVKCGAHAQVPAPPTGAARCEVCGSSELVPVEERAPAARNFSHKARRPA